MISYKIVKFLEESALMMKGDSKNNKKLSKRTKNWFS